MFPECLKTSCNFIPGFFLRPACINGRKRHLDIPQYHMLKIFGNMGHVRQACNIQRKDGSAVKSLFKIDDAFGANGFIFFDSPGII